MTMERRISKIAAVCILTFAAFSAVADDAASDGPILFTNVDVFDGVNPKLMKDVNVVETDNKITQITTKDLAVAGGTGDRRNGTDADAGAC